MKTISTFPQEHLLINRYVEEIFLPHALSSEEEDPRIPSDLAEAIDYGNADFHVILKDETTYAFTAFTPENIRELMERDCEQSFVSPGMIVLDVVSLGSILNAIEKCLELRERDHIPLEHFGILQTE